MPNGVCNMPGCNKIKVIGGFCTTHADPGAIAEKNRKVREREAQKKGQVFIDKPKPAVVSAPSVVSFDEIKSIDSIAYLRGLMDEKLEYFVSELSAAKNPKQKAQFYIGMCNAVEQLVY